MIWDVYTCYPVNTSPIWLVVTVHSQQEDSRFGSRPGSFCVLPWVCTGSLRVLRLPPSIHASGARLTGHSPDVSRDRPQNRTDAMGFYRELMFYSWLMWAHVLWLKVLLKVSRTVCLGSKHDSPSTRENCSNILVITFLLFTDFFLFFFSTFCPLSCIFPLSYRCLQTPPEVHWQAVQTVCLGCVQR